MKLNDKGIKTLYEKTKVLNGCGLTQTVTPLINPNHLPLMKEVDLHCSCFESFGIDARVALIAEHYGFDSQCEKLIEEMAELMVAIKHMSKKDECCVDYYDNFIEELGDVKILVSELEYMLRADGNGQQLDESINYKLNRELKRIQERDNA